jgi:hypothetical protein
VTPALAAWLAGLRAAGRPDEIEVKELLAGAGLASPARVRLPAGAAPPTADALGFPAPLVVKVCSPDLLHKSERGGVRVGVAAADLADAVAAMRACFPAADLLIEQRIAHAGPELILGALLDPDLGPAVMVGAGGVLAEIYRDVGFRLAPCPPAEARRLLDELTLAPIFSGFRGATCDGDALAALVSRLGELAVALGPRLGQLDVNPVVWDGAAWIALDGALVLAGGP